MHWKIIKTVLPNSSLAFVPPLGFTYSKNAGRFEIIASSTSSCLCFIGLTWSTYGFIIGLYGKHEPVNFSFIRHGRWSAGAHDKEKRETSESIYYNKYSTRKLGTSKKRSTQSARSVQSAVCMVCVSTWPWKWRHYFVFPQRFRWLKRVSSFPLRFRKRFCTEICWFSIPGFSYNKIVLTVLITVHGRWRIIALV